MEPRIKYSDLGPFGYHNREVHRDILNEIGEPAVLEQFAEEASKLSAAALKLSKILRGENPTPCSEEEAVEDLIDAFSAFRICEYVVTYAPKPELCDKKMAQWIKRIKLSKLEKKGDDTYMSMAKRCDICGCYYPYESKYEAKVVPRMSNTKMSLYVNGNSLDLCDDCAFKLASWISGDAVIDMISPQETEEELKALSLDGSDDITIHSKKG